MTRKYILLGPLGLHNLWGHIDEESTRGYRLVNCWSGKLNQTLYHYAAMVKDGK